jgi:hypothetical protein
VLAFGAALVYADWLDTAKDVLYFFENPYKWEAEHELWVGTNKPGQDDEDWDWFVSKLRQRANS